MPPASRPSTPSSTLRASRTTTSRPVCRLNLRTAARALDRVLRAGHYWVPHYYKAEHNIAYWNKYARPERAPLYNRGIIETWWQTSDTSDNKGKP